MARRPKTAPPYLRPDQIPPAWRETLLLIPGYDPIATAGDSLFDPAAAQRAIDFPAECLCHVEGAMAGKPFVLQPWQQAVVGNLFGWKRKDSQANWVRRYRKLLMYVPRKNGKTPLAAAIALYVFFLDPEAGQQNYLAAADREQAALLFRQMRGMIERSPRLSKRCTIYGGAGQGGQARAIVRVEDNSSTKVISADAFTKHGLTSHLVIVDELHAQPNRELYDVLNTSFASANRLQPLFLLLTTADFERPSVCNDERDYAVRVRDGKIDDPTYLPVIYELERGEDWTSEANWRKCNPNLGVSVSLDYLRTECAKAKAQPSAEPAFRQLHCNQKVDQILQRWLTDETWSKGAGPVDLDSLRGLPCWLGLDLSNRFDLTALVQLFRDGEGVHRLVPYFWIPREIARKKEAADKVPYTLWERQGYVRFTEGDVTDYAEVERFAKSLADEFQVICVGYDPYQAQQLATNLAGFGYQLKEFQQNTRSYHEPCETFERLLVEGKLLHGSNPVLDWNARNTSLKIDHEQRKRPVKPDRHSPLKIDGIQAALMALGVSFLTPPESDAGGSILVDL